MVYIIHKHTSRGKWNYFKYGIVMFFNKEGLCATNSFHSSISIFPSPFKSASSNVY